MHKIRGWRCGGVEEDGRGRGGGVEGWAEEGGEGGGGG